MDQHKISELIALFVSEEISDAERTELFELIAQDPSVQDQLDEALAVWDLAGVGDLSFEPDTALAWDKINPEEDTEEVPTLIPAARRKKISPFVWAGAATASIALLATLIFVLRSSPQGEQVLSPITSIDTVEVEEEPVVFLAEGEAIDLVLPDSSQVHLEPNSMLTLEFEDSSSQRVVFLEGEAYFKVAHDTARPFLVYTDHTLTRVLGTEFNVRAIPGETKQIVTVDQGVVSFGSHKESAVDSILLYKSDQGVYDLNISSLVREPGVQPRLLGGRSKEPSVLDLEIDAPENYLTPDLDIRNKLIRSSVVKYELTNEATLASYENIVMVVRYTTRKGTLEKVIEMEQTLAPGESEKGKVKLKDWFQKSELLGVEIKSATGLKP